MTKNIHITFDKDNMSKNELSRAKKTIKEKGLNTLTEGDLLRIFRDSTGWEDCYNGEILATSVSCFCSTIWSTDFEVEITIKGWKNGSDCFARIHFYMNDSCEVDTAKRIDPMTGEFYRLFKVDFFFLDSNILPCGIERIED